MMVERHVDGDATALGSKWSSVGSKTLCQIGRIPLLSFSQPTIKPRPVRPQNQELWGLESSLAHLCAQGLRGV
jgi:hypothetical protein